MYGCDNLGTLYQEGKGVKQNYFKAAELYQKACNNSLGHGCISLGVLYEYGKGVKPNTNKAMEYYGNACDMKEQDGCELYANLKLSDPYHE